MATRYWGPKQVTKPVDSKELHHWPCWLSRRSPSLFGRDGMLRLANNNDSRLWTLPMCFANRIFFLILMRGKCFHQFTDATTEAHIGEDSGLRLLSWVRGWTRPQASALSLAVWPLSPWWQPGWSYLSTPFPRLGALPLCWVGAWPTHPPGEMALEPSSGLSRVSVQKPRPGESELWRCVPEANRPQWCSQNRSHREDGPQRRRQQIAPYG